MYDYDIRLLTLFKQHYRDVYDEPLLSDYSCWGYYDGMDISENITCTSPNETLLPIPHNAPVPALWYYTGEKVSGLKGNYSAQNIGLIRHLSDDNIAYTTAFWEENPRMPFFSVALTQINDRLNFLKISHLIEQAGSTLDARLESDPFCRVIAYGSFDNTDLVLLLHSNSLSQLEKSLRTIELLPEVHYLHSIAGVSEQYLKKCENIGVDPYDFYGTKCFIDAILPEVQINVVTDGTPGVVEHLKSQLVEWSVKSSVENLCEAAVFNKNGHETFVIVLRNISVLAMLRLFVVGGIGTHQNPLYDHNVFNITTALFFNERALSDISAEKCSSEKRKAPSRWCKRLIDQYSVELKEALDRKDESLSSYYQAIFQTLNTLSQYEQFSLSEDIFLELIPSFMMFTSQFQKNLHNADANQVSIKESLREFLEYANLVIYHTIHTDQIFLMVPGYSGTSFSIPIKLTLLFLWFSWKFIRILNDSSNTYQYILTPVMESRPFTHLIDFGTTNHDRLIAIKVSQRSLYMPQHLTIILAHEIAHYVGRALRNRRERLVAIADLLAYYIVERLLPSENGEVREESCAKIFECYRNEISCSIGDHLTETVKTLLTGEAYASDCIFELCNSCRNWMVSQVDTRRSLFLNIPEVLEQELLREKSKYIELKRYLTKVQSSSYHQMQTLLRSNDCDAVIDEMFKISSEIFSDIAALIILDCPQSDFEDAFRVSEGVAVNQDALTASQWFRQDIAARVVFKTEGLKTDTFYLSSSPEDKPAPEEELYMYYGMKIQFENYATMCCNQIKKRIIEPDICPLVQEVRNFYSLFSGRLNNSFDDIYQQMVHYINEYEQHVRAELDSEFTA